MIRFSLRNPLLVNLLLVLVLALGLVAWHSLPREMFPAIERDRLQVRTTFEGASPEEVAHQVTQPIEEALDELTDIDTVTSTSQEGLSVITYKLMEGADTAELLREMRTAVDAIEDFPENADTPQLTHLKHNLPVISVALHGQAPMPQLYDLADRLRQELLQTPGVSGVKVSGQRDWEMWVELDPRKLAARGVRLNEVTDALRRNLRHTPSGVIRSAEGDILLRGIGAETAEEIGAVAVRRNAQGGQLRIRDLGGVAPRLEEALTLARFNGEPSVNLIVTKNRQQSTYQIAERVRQMFAGRDLPPGIRASLFADMSVPIENRVNTVQSSGAVALVLLLFALYFMLNFRMALITALGIPVAMMAAVITMALLGYSINMVSMFAFLVVLGLVVDDAIIISENTYRHIEEGLESHEAAYIGAREVLWPVLASIATTVAAFIPLFGISGTLGKFVEVIPVIVTAALLGSLLEAFLILPSHSAEVLRRRKTRDAALWKTVLARYRHLLAWGIRNRYLVAGAAAGVLLVTLAFMLTRLPYTQFPHVDYDEFVINVEAPVTYGLDDSARLATRIEDAIARLVPSEDLDSLLTNIGMTMTREHRYTFGSNRLQFNVNLAPKAPEGWIEAYVSPLLTWKFDEAGVRERPTEEITGEIRRMLETMPGIQHVSILGIRAGPAGTDIEIGIVGPEVGELGLQAERLREFLSRLPGVQDARHDLEPGKIEYQYALNERGRELGLTQAELATAVRMGYQGDKVVYINRADRRVPVRALYTEAMRRDAAAFRQLPIVTQDGAVYLHEVADIRATRSLSTIHRRDGERMVTITADVDASVTTPGTVTALVDREFGDRYRRLNDYRYQHMGAKQESYQATADLTSAALVALVLIFFILAALFKSLFDPLAVLATLPLALVGVVVGHALAGLHLQFLSLIGLLALSGVVINDSLILISFVKQLRASGHSRIDALLTGSRVRFRPILLTTLTTFLGISPLIFFATGRVQFLQPMALSLGVGLLFATVLILLVLPCLYLILDDFREWLRHAFRRWLPAQTPRPPEWQPES